jgi:hypothetical protein
MKFFYRLLSEDVFMCIITRKLCWCYSHHTFFLLQMLQNYEVWCWSDLQRHNVFATSYENRSPLLKNRMVIS